MNWSVIIPLTPVIWIIFGLLYVREVRDRRPGAKIELKFVVTGIVFGPIIMFVLLDLAVMRLLMIGMSRLLNLKL